MGDGNLGSVARPLRVAIVGSGPSGFYAAAALFKAKDLAVRVDVYDRLPTPYGLVRGGVAPDHQNIKAVIKAYERTAAESGFRFFGNVHVGRDVQVDDLYARYDAVIYAVGAESDRKLRIPGADLPGSYSATELVGWYNGHPDFQDRDFDLSEVTSVVVVGVGNVAMDVARVLAQRPERLEPTDITDEALARLRESAVREVHVLGRRGPVQAKFSPAEIREIGGLPGVDLVVRPEDAEVDAPSQAWMDALEGREQRTIQKNLDYLAERAAAGPGDASRQVRVWLCTSPTAILGEEHATGVEVERNEMTPGEGGEPWCEGTGQTEVIPAQLVFRAIGYRGIPLPGVPFDAKSGTIPNEDGRVLDAEAGEAIPGAYVVGWAKRGPSGLIGTNRADSVATVQALLADLVGTAPRALVEEDVVDWIRRVIPEVVTFEDWERLDALEVAEGERRGKVRHKFTRIEDAIAALRDERP